jgi:site-specific DNA recombinase
MSKPATPLPIAVAYTRKSTAGERVVNGKKQQKQENSLKEQREEIEKLARERFQIRKWFTDEGVSGWKRHAKRPDFSRMLGEVQELGAVAILVDHIDRFSRATYDDVMEDATALRKAGVKWIKTASGAEYDLTAGQRNDIGGIITFAAAVWAAHEYSRNLGRKITLGNRAVAERGGRLGGRVNYGLRGDKKEAKVVLWLFEQFAAGRSMNWLAGDLNARKVPAPEGGKWNRACLTRMLRNPKYAGDYVYNRSHRAQFAVIGKEAKVVEPSELNGEPGKVYYIKDHWKALIPRPLFDKVQRRLNLLAKDRSRRKRMGYPLSGVLFCSHCGHALYGCRLRGTTAVYRCGSPLTLGKGACGQWQVREDQILPYLMGLLAEERVNLETLLSQPPARLTKAAEQRQERHKEQEAEALKLKAQIDKAEKCIWEIEDVRTRKNVEAQARAMRDELEKLEKELTEAPEQEDMTKEEVKALLAWWDKTLDEAAAVPTDKIEYLADPHLEVRDGQLVKLCDPRLMNEFLHSLGCQVKLRWETEDYQTRNGIARRRHVLTKGRWQMGQREGSLPREVLEPTQ